MAANRKERAARLSALMEHIKEQAAFNGVILVADQGTPLLCEAIGSAEFGKDGVRPLTTNSMFELASVSKPITALGIIRLQQLGQLDWDAPVSGWLPELPYPGITVRHLLSHTSGLPDYIELFAKKWNSAHCAVNSDVVDMLAAHNPASLFAPNDSWMYSNTGYIILAILIERISGQSYASFLSEQIFQPLGMTRTRVYNRRLDPGPVPKDYALGYVYRLECGGYVLPDNVPELSYVHYLDGLQGDGMVNSTVEDLLRLDRALYDDNFINPQLREVMFAPVQLNNGDYFDYGFGWLIKQHLQLGKVMWHNGGWPGYAALFKRYVDHDATLILLQNGEREIGYTEHLVQSIEQILAGEHVEAPQPAVLRKIVPHSAEEFEPFPGRYRFSNEPGKSLIVEVYVKHSQLYVRLDNGMILSLLPIGNGRFYEQQTATELEFVGIESGKSSQLIWYDRESRNVADRIQEYPV